MLSPGLSNLENLPKDSINPTIKLCIIYLMRFEALNSSSNYCSHSMRKAGHTIGKDCHIPPDSPQYNWSHTAHGFGTEANRREDWTFDLPENRYQKLFSLTDRLHFPNESFLH